MKYYAITCTDAPESLHKRQSLRQSHLSRLQELSKQNRLLTAGPYFEKDSDNYIEGVVIGSIIIAQFKNLHDATEWASSDPFVTAGIYANVSIRVFKPVEI